MKHYALTYAVLFVAGLALAACGDDTTKKTSDAGDAGGDTTKDSGPAKGDKDASVPGMDAGKKPVKDAGMSSGSDAGDDAGGNGAQAFHVPSGGGMFHFMTAAGVDVSFKFPAGAAGKDITVTPVSASDVTWADASFKTSFSDAIELGPKGTTFSTPVEVKVGKGALMVLNFSDPKKPADPLLLSADGKSLLLTHFSTLGIVDPDSACESTSGWSDAANDQLCLNQGTATTLRQYGCKNYAFCYLIQASCCVVPGNTNKDCELGDKNLVLKYTRSDSNGGAYPYCDLAGGTGSLPYVQGHSPANLAATSADQVITLTGTGFTASGSALIGGDIVVDTTFVSATEVTATVPGSYLTTAGTLSSVGFVLEKSTASAACTSAATSNCDFIGGRSNLVSIPIQ